MAAQNKTPESGLKIQEQQRRRADNQIWNAAGSYDFTPQLRAYDAAGNAQLYWNSIIGAVQKHYGDVLEPVWEKTHAAVAEDLCLQLVWLGLENACYERESRQRPAFPLLRQAYALELLEGGNIVLPEPYAAAYRLHFEKAADACLWEPGNSAANTSGCGADRQKEITFVSSLPGSAGSMEPALQEQAAAVLEQLELSGDLNGEELVQALLTFLDEKTLLLPKIDPAESSRFRIPLPFGLGRKRAEQAETDPAQRGAKPRRCRSRKKEQPLPGIRGFGAGIGEYTGEAGNDYVETGKHHIWDLNEQQSETAISTFVHNICGTPLYSAEQVQRLERTLCCGDHDGCRLWFSKGDDWTNPEISGYASVMRRNAIRQMAKNYEYYEKNRDQARNAIRGLTEKWRNAFLTYRQDNTVSADSGLLRGNRVWRLEMVDDRRIFDHVITADDGDFCVDILLDASLSQEERQQRVALQGYIIAEALTRCQIPVRVCGFSSLSGYTVLTRYRDYRETDTNEQIFHYTTFGGNRDGLAVRLLGHLMETDTVRPAHRILLVLSDARPNDALYIRSGGVSVPYKGAVSVENTAKEIRFLRNRGIAVLCVYTGTDEDLPAAHQIYNRDFVRIRSLEHFAQAVGNLMLTQLRS